MTFQPDVRQLAWLKAALFALCLLPLVSLLLSLGGTNAPADPVEFAQGWTGTWTFNFLLLTLCVSPLRSISQLHWLLRLRRMLGLFTFFYATLHLLAFIGLEHAFAIDAIARDAFKQPYIGAGFAAYLLLIPLAATSSQWAIRQLGGRRWQELHRSIYLIGILAGGHYFWLSETAELLWPLGYAAVLGVLLGWRIRERRRKAIPVARFQNTKPIKFFQQRPD
jgi:sulfoxide reductase heme-binding subunit YedZ